MRKVICILVQKIRAKCNKFKKSVSLKNTNHAEAFVVHIDLNKIKVMFSFYDGVFTP